MTRTSLIYFFSFLLLLNYFPEKCFSQKMAPKVKGQYKVSGKITQTEDYCGGAKPSEEMLHLLSTPSAFKGKKIYFRNGDHNLVKNKIIHEITADSTGRFCIKLPPGTYCILQEEQVKALDIEHFKKKQTKNLKLDEQCLKLWWDKCFMTFEVKDKDISDLNINFHITCFTNGIPCMIYTGPLPP